VSTVFFEAQTGTTYDERPTAPSNFHLYELDDTPEMRDFVEAAADRALERSLETNSTVLEYDADFLTFLKRKDKSGLRVSIHEAAPFEGRVLQDEILHRPGCPKVRKP